MATYVKECAKMIHCIWHGLAVLKQIDDNKIFKKERKNRTPNNLETNAYLQEFVRSDECRSSAMYEKLICITLHGMPSQKP